METFFIQATAAYPPMRPDTRFLSSKDRGEGGIEEKREGGKMRGRKRRGRGDIDVWEVCV